MVDPTREVMKSSTGSKFKSVCVFCGAHAGRKKIYQEEAIKLGEELVRDEVRRNIGLVYGGGSAGLMGLVARTVHRGEEKVFGVTPRALMRAELIGLAVGEVKIVADMHERKAEMHRHADAFIALPGGYGTLEEVMEMITWHQLGIHAKPVGLLNVEGYYDFLLAFVDNAVKEGFIQPVARRIIVAATTAHELFTMLEEYTPALDESLCWVDTPALSSERRLMQSSAAASSSVICSRLTRLLPMVFNRWLWHP